MPSRAPSERILDFNSASNLYADAEEVSGLANQMSHGSRVNLAAWPVCKIGTGKSF